MKALHPREARITLLSLLLLLVIAGSGVLGCSEAEAPAGLDLPPAQALRLRFPDHADAVLAPVEDFVSTAEGFTLGAAAVLPRVGSSVEITLPRNGRGVTRLLG